MCNRHLRNLSARLLLVSITAVAALTVVPALADNKDETLRQKAADSGTALKVKVALLDKIGWDMLDVDVEANGSHVVLMGEADSKAHCDLAKEVALAVDGVNEVDNKLQVDKSPSEAPVGDAVTRAEGEVQDAILESRVKTALLAEIGANAFDIEVEASQGEVSLRGHVETNRHEELALQIAKKTDGVKKVVDLLSVKS